MPTRQTPSSAARLHCEPLEDRWVPSTLTVDDDGPNKPSKGQYTTIQAAVNAAHAGDKIVVSPGTYKEQVTIPADKDGLTLVSDKSTKAVIQAPTTLTGANPALVHVAGADDVTIKGFTVRGLDANGVGRLYSGVSVDGGGSATITGNRILDVRDTAPLQGLQSGLAVDVEGSNPSDPTVARVDGNEIRGYQKDGVLVSGPGAKGTVTRNEIEGDGPNAVIAQNGIDVSNQARATVTGNDVSDNVYTGPANTSASGIIVVGAGDVSVSGNDLDDNQTGIDVEDTTGVEVSFNDIGDGDVGINMVRADRAAVVGNDIDDQATAGIYVGGTNDATFALNAVEKGGFGLILLDSDGNNVFANVIRKNDFTGVYVFADSTDNTFQLNVLVQNGDGVSGVDAFDGSTGTKTAGTANTWRFNLIGTSDPAGLR